MDAPHPPPPQNSTKPPGPAFVSGLRGSRRRPTEPRFPGGGAIFWAPVQGMIRARRQEAEGVAHVGDVDGA